jgi:hypothetical protein
MSAFATSGAAFASTQLDPGRDDYYGTGRSGEARVSPFLRRLDAMLVPVTVAFSGAGRVTSAASGVDCTTGCTTRWQSGADVWLTGEGTATTRFVRWTGACTGADDCRLSPSEAATVTAVFGPLTVPVRTSVSGRGRVVCSPRCSARFAAGNVLTLRAVAQTGWRFTGWSGACRGARPVCRPATDFGLSARAVFRRM